MEAVDRIKCNRTSWVLASTVAVVGLLLASCDKNSPPVPKAQYSAKVVGHWQGTVGEMKETMSIDGDGTFICQLHPTGFIANTLYPRATGTIRGTWTITGAVINLRITDVENERLRNSMTSSTIVAFNENELVLKSDRGDTSSFKRMRDF